MIRRGIWLVPLILLVLFLGGGILLWLNQNLVKRGEEVYTGHGETARRNPFYTAERLLNRLDVTVHSVRRLSDLPDSLATTDTLLVALPTYALSAADSQHWLDWVARGGHLIIGVRHEHEPGRGLDHLLGSLQVRSHRVESLPIEPAPVRLHPTLAPLHVGFQSDLRLNDDVWRQIRWSQGQVTLLTDIDVFANERLVDHDHADFLWMLLRHTTQHGGEVWLQYRPLIPSLAQLLWRYGWMPLTGLILTVLIALWLYSRRLGPLLVPRSDPRRRLAEHLRASSRFLWRHGAGPVLLQAARQYTLRRLERRRPETAQIAALAHSDQPLTEHELIHTLQTLQRLDRQPP